MDDKTIEIINFVNELNSKVNELVNNANIQQQQIMQLDRNNRVLALKCDLLKNISTNSQFLQDLFVLKECGNKKNGYFVEFGATNGVELGNSYFLEKKL